MGWITYTEHDGREHYEHEGWVRMTYADGAVGTGVSCGAGHYVSDTEIRPDAEIVGWLPSCACGWVGIEASAFTWDGAPLEVPDAVQEELIMGQWRIHMRDAVGAYPPRAELAAALEGSGRAT